MALFKIYNNIDTQNDLPKDYHKGWMYFDISKKLFYIDVKDGDYDPATDSIIQGNPNPDDQSTWYRFPLNAHGAQKAAQDINGAQIDTTYVKYLNYKDKIIDGKLPHKLTFGAGGAYVFDGSADVEVPVYRGTYSVS